MNDYRTVSFSAHQFELEPNNQFILGDEVVFQGSGSVVNENRKDNQYGTQKVVYKVQPKLLEVRKSVEGQVVDQPSVKTSSSGKRSHSQRLRDSIYRLWESNGMMGEFDDYYSKVMDKIITSVQAKIDDF